MSAKVKNFLVALALIFSIGLQWPILQSIAWANMLITYSQHDGLEKAFSKTFDSNHPCKVCKFVAEGKQAEKSNTNKTSLKKLDLISASSPNFLFAEEPFNPEADFICSLSPCVYPPLSPPPDRA